MQRNDEGFLGVIGQSISNVGRERLDNLDARLLLEARPAAVRLLSLDEAPLKPARVGEKVVVVLAQTGDAVLDVEGGLAGSASKDVGLGARVVHDRGGRGDEEVQRVGLVRTHGAGRVARAQDDLDVPGAVLADGGDLDGGDVGQALGAEETLVGLEGEVVAAAGRVVEGRVGVLDEPRRRVSERVVGRL